jgi:hypothetical protein
MSKLHDHSLKEPLLIDNIGKVVQQEVVNAPQN